MAGSKVKGYITFDIETLPDKKTGSALLGEPCYITKCDENGVTGFEESDLTGWMLHHIFKPDHHGKIIYAHNGFRFDYKHLSLSRLADLGFYGEIIADKNNNYKAIDVHSPDGAFIWHLQDSFIKFNLPLKKLLITFAPHLPKGDINFDKENFDVNNPEHIAYALRDSEGLYYAIEKIDDLFKSRFDISFHDRPTAPSLSLHAFKHFCKHRKVQYPHAPKFSQDEYRAAYFGGQTLALDCNQHDDVMVIDIHSSYGATMLQNPMPFGEIDSFATPEGSAAQYEDADLVEASVYVSRETFPALKSVVVKDGKPHKGNNAGHLDGYWYGCELRQAVAMGTVITDIRRIWRYAETTDILQRFISILKKMRQADGKTKGPLDAVGKLLQNSLYGKFAQEKADSALVFGGEMGPDDESEFDYQTQTFSDTVRRVPKESRGLPAPIQWGAYITALSRCRLNAAIALAPEKILYCDTDSVFIKRCDFPIFEHLIGPEYGQWGIEDDKRGTFRGIAPKAYMIGTKRVNKGIPKKEFERMEKLIKKENPEFNDLQIQNELAKILTVNFVQMRGIGQVQNGKDRGGIGKRATAKSEKVSVGSFDQAGKWRADFYERPAGTIQDHESVTSRIGA